MEQRVKSLYKALKLLTYFDEEHKEAGITELAEYSGMLKSSVFNIMRTFEECGYVKQDSDTRKYMLGGEIVSLFSRYKVTRSIDYRVTEYLQQIRDRFKVNTYLVERDGEKAVYLCAEQSFYKKDDRLVKEGTKIPLHCTAGGKVLLGYSEVSHKEYICSGKLERFTKNTITDGSVLKAQLEKIIYDVYAVSNEEYQLGNYCVAVPIVAGAGYSEVNYAVVIRKNEPITPYLLKKYVSELKHISREIGSILLGDAQ